MTFLHEHTTVDVGHNRLRGEYITRLVPTEADEAAVVYALHVTAKLYAAMLATAIESAEAPLNIGVRHEEAQRVVGPPPLTSG